MKTVIVVDSNKTVPYRRADNSIFKAVEHFGIYYEVIDLSWNRISSPDLKEVHLLILGQEGISKSLSEEEFSSILKSVYQGMGLVIFDGFIEWYPESFLKTIKIDKFSSGKTKYLKILSSHWIGSNSAKEEIELKRDIFYYYFPEISTSNVFLYDGERNPCGISIKFGKGKIVIFSISAGLWQDEYLGHTEGLDGVFFRSIVWTAKKPFITKTMPPFITARIDDVSGSGSKVARYIETVKELKYLDILNNYRFTPNFGFFIDDIEEIEEKVIKEKYYDGLAEFSPHAFSDPKNINEFPIYMKHNGEEFDEKILRENFKKVDYKFAKIGIKMSKTLNAHFGEIGLKSLPFLKERGVKYFMNPIRIGKSWENIEAHKWDIKPYNKPFFSLGYIPEDRFFFNTISLPPKIEFEKISSEKPDFDFLYGCTTFNGENKKTDIEKAIKRGIFQIKRGIENGFFGCLMTHEQRISHLTLSEFEEIIKKIAFHISPGIFKSYDYISQYAESREGYRIEKIEYKNGLSVHLKGKIKIPQYLCLFFDDRDEVKQSFLEVPAFEKYVILNFKI